MRSWPELAEHAPARRARRVVRDAGEAADGLDNPASLAFGTSHGERKTLYLTNFAVFSAAPKPGLLRVAVGVPGEPLR